MDRFEATKLLVGMLDRELVVSNLGSASGHLYDAGDRPENLYLLGSMGLCSSVGLGLALAVEDRKVIVLDGDGSLLMNLGSLTTIAQKSPPNLVHIVWDNEQYAETGGQRTATSGSTDLAHIARGAGIEQTTQVRTLKEFAKAVDRALHKKGPWFILAKVEQNEKPPWPPNEPEANAHRFRTSVVGTE